MLRIGKILFNCLPLVLVGFIIYYFSCSEDLKEKEKAEKIFSKVELTNQGFPTWQMLVPKNWVFEKKVDNYGILSFWYTLKKEDGTEECNILIRYMDYTKLMGSENVHELNSGVTVAEQNRLSSLYKGATSRFLKSNLKVKEFSTIYGGRVWKYVNEVENIDPIGPNEVVPYLGIFFFHKDYFVTMYFCTNKDKTYVKNVGEVVLKSIKLKD